MKILFAAFAFCLMFIPHHFIYAQSQQANSAASNEISAVCSQKFINDAETLFQKRWRSTEVLLGAERKLAAILKQCSNLTSQPKLREHLLIVQEERAAQLFKISLYYLKKFQEGESSSLSGGCLRLKQIEDKYSNYSQMVDVKALLKGDNCSIFFRQQSQKR